MFARIKDFLAGFSNQMPKSKRPDRTRPNLLILEQRLVPANLVFMNPNIDEMIHEKEIVRFDKPVTGFGIEDVTLSKMNQNGTFSPISKKLMNVIPSGNGTDYGIIGLQGAAFGSGKYKVSINLNGVTEIPQKPPVTIQASQRIPSITTGAERSTDAIMVVSPIGPIDVPKPPNSVPSQRVVERTWSQVPGKVEIIGSDWYDFGVLQVPEMARQGNIVSVSAGATHTIALTEQGNIISWGNNWYGKLNTPANLGKVVQVSAGWDYTAVLTEDGRVRAWGSLTFNSNSLEWSDIVSISAQASLVGLRRNGSIVQFSKDPSSLQLPPANLRNVVDISAGGEINAAVLADGKVAVWGAKSAPRELLNVPPDAGFVIDAEAGNGNILYQNANGKTFVVGNTAYLCDKIDAKASGLVGARKLVGHSNFASMIDGNKNLVSNFPGSEKYAKSADVIDSANGWVHSVILIKQKPKNLYEVTGNPWALASGDFNGDGKPDLVTTGAQFSGNTGNNSISVLLGGSAGGFNRTDYVVGMNPVAVATGDLNRDGKNDLVVSNLYSPSVSVLLGNGDGTFRSQMVTRLKAQAMDVVLADFNRDGILDLATANVQSASVSVMLGRGNGTFGLPTDYRTPARPNKLAIADLNRDGYLDIAASSDGAGGAVVLFGNRYGTFSAASSYQAGYLAYKISTADMNADGFADLLLSGPSNNVVYLQNNRNGTFGSGVIIAAGNATNGLAVGDVNRDGRPDIVVANYNDKKVSVVLNLGGGRFASPVSYSVGLYPWAVSLGDFDGDGFVDIACANSGLSANIAYAKGSVSILYGNGSGSFLI